MPTALTLVNSFKKKKKMGGRETGNGEVYTTEIKLISQKPHAYSPLTIFLSYIRLYIILNYQLLKNYLESLFQWKLILKVLCQWS